MGRLRWSRASPAITAHNSSRKLKASLWFQELWQSCAQELRQLGEWERCNASVFRGPRSGADPSLSHSLLSTAHPDCCHTQTFPGQFFSLISFLLTTVDSENHWCQSQHLALKKKTSLKSFWALGQAEGPRMGLNVTGCTGLCHKIRA